MGCTPETLSTRLDRNSVRLTPVTPHAFDKRNERTGMNCKVTDNLSLEYTPKKRHNRVVGGVKFKVQHSRVRVRSYIGCGGREN